MIKIKGVEIREQIPNIAKHVEGERDKKIKETRQKLRLIAEHLSKKLNKKVTLGDLIEIFSYVKKRKPELRKDYKIVFSILLDSYTVRDIDIFINYADDLKELVSKRFAK